MLFGKNALYTDLATVSSACSYPLVKSDVLTDAKSKQQTLLIDTHGLL